MDDAQVTDVVERVRALVETRYVFPEVAAQVCDVLTAGLAERRYPREAQALAAAMTADLQSINSDKHLRLRFHAEPLPAQTLAIDGDAADDGDDGDLAAMATWAAATGGGVAGVQCRPDNIGYLELAPVLFPTVLCGEMMTAAMTLVAGTRALIVDLRRTLGGEPSMVAFAISYLWDHEPVQLTGLRERGEAGVTQFWTLPYVPGRRFGKIKPVYVLTSSTTFSGGEQFTYDLKRLGRAVVVGERTRGGANAREGFTVHPHLEATISVAAAIDPDGGPNWEGSGIVPDVEVAAGDALEAAHRLVIERLGTSTA
jgi:hypothetical protein